MQKHSDISEIWIFSSLDILFCLTLYMVRTKLVLWTVVHPGKIEMLFGVGVTLDQRHTDDGRGQIYLFI